LTICGAGFFESRAATTTSDRVCTAFITCAFGFFETSAPTASTQRTCAAWSVCGSNQYEIRAPTASNDRQCAFVVSCNANQYQVSAPTFTSDRVCAFYTVCGAGFFQTIAPTLTSDRFCAAVALCGSTQFEVAAPTTTSNRVCQFYTVCGSNQWESRAPTAFVDRQCAFYTVCGSNQWQTVAPTAFRDRQCAFYTVCLSTQYQVIVPTFTSDRACAFYTVCGANTFETQAPTPSSDRICSALVTCTSGQFEFRAPTSSTNRICQAYTVCGSNQWQSGAPTTTTDRRCSFISVCGAGFYVSALATGFSDTVCSACGCSVNGVCVATGFSGVGVALAVSATCPALGAELTTVYTTTHRCQCNTGFAGNGFFCEPDVDGDGFPALSISGCTDSCFRCRRDICPSRNDVFRPIFINSVAGVDDVTNLRAHSVVWPFPSPVVEVDPVWTITGNGLEQGNGVQQIPNSKPGAIYGDYVFGGVDFSTIITPGITTPLDDDYFGVIFGFNGLENTFIAQWKHTDIGAAASDAPSTWNSPTSGTVAYFTDDFSDQYVAYARAGLSIKRVQGPVAPLALWGTVDLFGEWPGVKTVFHDAQRRSWTHNKSYRWDVSYRPAQGFIQVRIFDLSTATPTLVIDTGAIYPQQVDPTITLPATGRIGMYGLSQGNLLWSNIDFSCCDGYQVGEQCFPFTICGAGQTVVTGPTAYSDRVCSP